MPVIGLVGGHGVGKSTAVKRWHARYSSLLTYSLDDLRKEYYDNAAKVALVKSLQADRRIGVVESAKGYSDWLKEFGPADTLFIVTAIDPVNLGRQWMEQRKSKPLSNWWNADRLNYELRIRFLNFAAKHLNKDQVTHFDLRSRDEWDVVDEEFGRVFRKLNNTLNRR